MAANVQAVATSFKKELLQGIHAFDSAYRTADFFYGALYQVNSSIGASIATYTATGEVSGAGYTAGGKSFAGWQSVTASGTSAFTTPTANLVWTSVTITTAFDCLLIYNQSQGNKAVASFTFLSQTVVAGTITVTMPTNTSGSALLQIN